MGAAASTIARAEAELLDPFFIPGIWGMKADGQVYFIQKIKKVAEISCLGPLYILYTYARVYRDARDLIKYLKIILDTGELSSIIKMGEYYYYFFIIIGLILENHPFITACDRCQKMMMPCF